MQFSDYLNQIMNALDISNTELADAIHISQSYVSRIRKGSRAIPAGGKLHKSIYFGLQNILNKKEGMEEKNAQILPERYEDFLLASFDDLQLVDLFHKQLNKIMDLLKVSNQELAQNIYCDESLISKYRSGERIPKDLSTYRLMIQFFSNRIVNSDRFEEYTQMLKCKSQSIEDVERTILNLFFKKKKASDFILKMMMNNMENKPTESFNYSRLATIINQLSLPSQKVNVKKGRLGLRKQVLIFLAICAKIKDPVEIKLFSNQNIQWLIEDQKFFETMRFLMMAIMQQGHQLTLIYNLSGQEEGLNTLIEGWASFHHFGNLSLYQFVQKPDLPFKHTLLILQDQLCISGSAIDGLDQDASYYLIQDKEEVKRAETSFNQILLQSEKFFHTRIAHNYEEAIRFLKRADSLEGESFLFSIQASLPLWTMEEDLFRSILEENQVAYERKIQLLDWLGQVKQFYQHHLSNKDIFESFYLPTVILENRIPLDIPLFHDQDQPLYYSSNAFIKHLESTVEQIRLHSNYRIAILTQSRFDNVKLIQYGENNVLAMRYSFPFQLVNHTHPAINQIIKQYIRDTFTEHLQTSDQLEAVFNKISKTYAPLSDRGKS